MRNLIVLLFLIIACNAFAGPATFQGNNVKLFKDRLLFNSGVSIATSESEDPTIVAKDGLIGSLYIRSTTGVVYNKQDNGVTTNWKPIAKYPVDLEDGKILVGNASNEATAVSMSGEATITNTGAVTLDNDSIIGKALTGHVAGAGVVAATDSIADAIEKLDGNVIATTSVANAALPSASFTDANVTGKLITGFTSGAGTVAATDTILQAVNKLDGNDKAQDALSELNDVTLTLPAEGHHLEHNGTEWVNSDMQESAGLRTYPTLTDNGNGTVGLNSVEVGIRSDADHMNPIVQRTVPANPTIALTDNSTNYIYVTWNAGSPIYAVTTDRTLINESNTLPVYRIYRSGIFIHSVDWDALANGLANKLHSRITATDAFKYESGLSVADKDGAGAGLVLTVSSGFAWHGAVRETLAAMDTSVGGESIRTCYHVASVWNCSTTSTGYNNTKYDDGTAKATLGNGRYGVNWLFRGIEDQTHLYTVLGTGNYTLTEATNAALPSLPELISSHAILVAKIVVLKSATVPTSIQVPSSINLTGGSASNHNDTLNKDGGDGTFWYHQGLNTNERLKDIDAINYVKGYASNFESTTANSITGLWTSYDDGSAIRPVDGTGGSPSTLTLSVNNTTPLLGTGDFSIAKSAADGRGEGVAYAYTVSKAHQTQILEVSFDYDTTSANYSCDYSVTPSICDMGVYSYDGTNAYLIGELPAGKGTFRGTFQADSANTHRIIFHVQTTDSAIGGYVVLIDNIVVKPQAPSVSGLAGWVEYNIASYVSAGTGVTLATAQPYKSLDGTWRMKFNINWNSTGTKTSESATITGVSMVVPQSVDSFVSTGSIVDSSSVVNGATSIASNHASLATTAYRISGDVVLTSKPSWAVDYSNVVLSSSTSNREIYARYSKANVQTLGTETIVDFSTPVSDKTNAVTTGAAWKFTAYEDGTYTIEPRILPLFASVVAGQTAEMYLFKNGVSVERLDALLFHGTQANKYVSMGKQTTIPLKKGDYVDIRVTNGTSGLLTTANDVTFNAISIYKLNTGSQTIGKEPRGYAAYRFAGGEVIGTSNTLMDWSVKVKDNAVIKVTTGASWKAECTRDGVFEATGRYGLATTTQQALTVAYKNGAVYLHLEREVNGAAVTTAPSFTFIDQCNKGDYYTFYGYSSTANTIDATTPELLTHLIMTLE